MQGSEYLQAKTLGNWYSRTHLKTPLGSLLTLGAPLYLSFIKAIMLAKDIWAALSSWSMRMKSGASMLAVSFANICIATNYTAITNLAF